MIERVRERNPNAGGLSAFNMCLFDYFEYPRESVQTKFQPLSIIYKGARNVCAITVVTGTKMYLLRSILKTQIKTKLIIYNVLIIQHTAPVMYTAHAFPIDRVKTEIET